MIYMKFKYILNTRFSKTYRLRFLNMFISYHTLHAEMSFFDHYGLLE
jgi:hypothetical protein